MFQLLAVLAAVVALLGVALFVRGMVGTLRTDLPRCRSCGHDLRSYGEVPVTCAGCGAALTAGGIRFGPRVRRPRLAWLGAALFAGASICEFAGASASRLAAERARAEALRQAVQAARARVPGAASTAGGLASWRRDIRAQPEFHSGRALPRRERSRLWLELSLRASVGAEKWPAELHPTVRVTTAEGTVEGTGTISGFWGAEGGSLLLVRVDLAAIPLDGPVSIDIESASPHEFRWHFDAVQVDASRLVEPGPERTPTSEPGP